MPKHLLLMRHAQSFEKQSHERDKDRELSPNGVKESVQIGIYLAGENARPDVIFCSNANRAKATAQLTADAMKYGLGIIFEDELYEASVRTFFDFITKLDDQYHHVMCVGHNPTISYLAEYLTQAEIGDMATAGLAMIKFNTSSWSKVSKGSGELLNYVSPSMILNT